MLHQARPQPENPSAQPGRSSFPPRPSTCPSPPHSLRLCPPRSATLTNGNGTTNTRPVISTQRDLAGGMGSRGALGLRARRLGSWARGLGLEADQANSPGFCAKEQHKPLMHNGVRRDAVSERSDRPGADDHGTDRLTPAWGMALSHPFLVPQERSRTR